MLPASMQFNGCDPVLAGFEGREVRRVVPGVLKGRTWLGDQRGRNPTHEATTSNRLSPLDCLQLLTCDVDTA